MTVKLLMKLTTKLTLPDILSFTYSEYTTRFYRISYTTVISFHFMWIYRMSFDCE